MCQAKKSAPTQPHGLWRTVSLKGKNEYYCTCCVVLISYSCIEEADDFHSFYERISCPLAVLGTQSVWLVNPAVNRVVAYTK